MRSLEGETGLACVKVDEENRRVSGTPRKSNSGQSCPDTTTTRLQIEEVLLLMAKTPSPSPLVHKNPGGFRQEPPQTETAGSRDYDLLSHVHGHHPGWVQRTVPFVRENPGGAKTLVHENPRGFRQEPPQTKYYDL